MYPGVDIIEIERVTQISARYPRFLARLFTERERALLAPKGPASAAVRFAGKEAVLKAMGTGLAEGLSWHDVEILEDERRAPVVCLSARALALAERRGGKEVRISLSHDRTHAVAFAVLC